MPTGYERTDDFTQQYMPISRYETLHKDGLSVRHGIDQMKNLGNARYFAHLQHLITDYYPFAGDCQSDSGTTDPHVVRMYAGRWAPGDMPNMLLEGGGVFHASGAGGTLWSAYTSTKVYNGPRIPFDSDFLDSESSTANSFLPPGGGVHQALVSAKFPFYLTGPRLLYVTLVAQNISSGANDYSWLSNFTCVLSRDS